METIPGNERPHGTPETESDPGEDVREAPPGNAGGVEGVPQRDGRVPSESGGSIEQALRPR
jgi:hypothetical protein